MMPLKLVTKREASADKIREKLLELVELATKQDFTALAVVIAHTDGSTFVSSMAQGNRTLLLGAVTDLQYTLAKDGDQ